MRPDPLSLNHPSRLDEVSQHYQQGGHNEELISLLESGIGLERAHMGIFTELGIVYGRYKSDKLMEHLKLFSGKINIPRLIRSCEEQQHWKELTFLYIQVSWEIRHIGMILLD